MYTCPLDKVCCATALHLRPASSCQHQHLPLCTQNPPRCSSLSQMNPGCARRRPERLGISVVGHIWEVMQRALKCQLYAYAKDPYVTSNLSFRVSMGGLRTINSAGTTGRPGHMKRPSDAEKLYSCSIRQPICTRVRRGWQRFLLQGEVGSILFFGVRTDVCLKPRSNTKGVSSEQQNV